MSIGSDFLRNPGFINNVSDSNRKAEHLIDVLMSAKKGPESVSSEKAEFVAGEFEAILLNFMMKEMWKTIPESELFPKSVGSDYYLELFQSELASKVAKENSLGVKNDIMKSIEKYNNQLSNHTPDNNSDNNNYKSTISDSCSRTEPVSEYEKVRSGYTDKELQTTEPQLNSANDDDNLKHLFTNDTPILPVSGRISSGYGMRIDPFSGKHTFHNGVDIAAQKGTPIKAAETGKVIFSGWKNGFGKCVVVAGDDGTEFIYAHNSKNLVQVNDVVQKGTEIAKVGKTGRSTGTHVHFEIRKHGKSIDPIKYLNRIS
ncbi:MAG: hypothetical protein A2161_00620 [Candidatus Schekmanbacteria bacterium RBG_13_48_7]|uniref:Peptidase M23 domain-containing protein n=1 Tax=Candidatus Schekmanbacteria bacterium RBG_13_48_7 TaxID=1817878 RepID=A0A1F7RK94_9BACT|nr:MAG: hypothetical protein A2161_00620 [Candidatus Schekmanbacteria bacterium RBG_13_48_7]